MDPRVLEKLEKEILPMLEAAPRELSQLPLHFLRAVLWHSRPAAEAAAAEPRGRDIRQQAPASELPLVDDGRGRSRPPRDSDQEWVPVWAHFYREWEAEHGSLDGAFEEYLHMQKRQAGGTVGEVMQGGEGKVDETGRGAGKESEKVKEGVHGSESAENQGIASHRNVLGKRKSRSDGES